MASPSPSIDVLHDDELRFILGRLHPADILRASVAWRRWRSVAAVCLPRTGALLGYFYEPISPPPRTLYPSFLPISASSPRLSFAFAPKASRFKICDSHLGLLVLVPKKTPRPGRYLSQILVLDPANHRSVHILEPPRDLLPEVLMRVHRTLVGAAVLSRAHPSRFHFEVVCLTIERNVTRLWIVSVGRNGEISWRVLPPTTSVVLLDDASIESRCVHAAGSLYWHIPKNYRVLLLDPAAMRICYLVGPDALARHEYRVGETAENQKLCLAAFMSEKKILQIWVCDGAMWVLQKEMGLGEALDTTPELASDMELRVSDIDGGTGRVFMSTSGNGSYSFHLETGEICPLRTDDGVKLGHPIFAYTFWPPALLAGKAEAA